MRGQEFDDAQKPVRRSCEDGVLQRGVGGGKCAERVDGVWVPSSWSWKSQSQSE
jgi:hypothetical protein